MTRVTHVRVGWLSLVVSMLWLGGAVVANAWSESDDSHAASDASVLALRLNESLAPTRSIEARFDHPGSRAFRPYDAPRGRGITAESISASLVAALEALGDLDGVATTLTLRGSDPSVTLRWLERAPSTPALDNTRAVVMLQSGRPRAALRLLDALLTRRPDFAPALWNRGLALQRLGLLRRAAQVFQRVADAGEPGWSQEARARVEVLARQHSR